MPENFQEEYQEDGNTPPQGRDNTPRPSGTPLEGGNNLGRGQKIAVVFLGIFAILVIVIWAAQFKNSISGPLAYKGAESNNQEGSFQEDSDEVLKTKDTDSDGLSDWEELNIYLTSPFLEDSDSDGYKDKEEIDNDNDPNCPVGRECYGPAVSDIKKDNLPEEDISASDEELLELLLSELNSQEEANTETGLTEEETKAIQDLLSGKSSVDDIREILRVYGMDDSTLSDEQVMDMYQNTLLSNSQ